MTPELRAAAQRLRACHKLAGGKLDVARVYSGDDHSIIADAETLALAWLAEHLADDGEPIDNAWMRSVGFRDGSYDDEPDSDTSIWEHCRKDDVAFYKEDCELFIRGEGWGRKYKTRGAVRRLCAALGVTLQEPNT